MSMYKFFILSVLDVVFWSLTILDLTWGPWRVEVVQTPGEDHDVVHIQPASHHRSSVANTLGQHVRVSGETDFHIKSLPWISGKFGKFQVLQHWETVLWRLPTWTSELRQRSGRGCKAPKMLLNKQWQIKITSQHLHLTSSISEAKVGKPPDVA